MSESNLTPHTAPRTLEGLTQESPFKLRLLLTDLGGMVTEEQKMAWHHLVNTEQKATHILAYLKQWDAANPGAANPAPAQPPTVNGTHTPQAPPPPAAPPAFAPPAPSPGFMMPTFAAPQPIQPVTAGMAAAPVGPAAVSPQAAAQAAAATQGESGKGRTRQPRNGSAGPGGDADVGAQVLTMLQTVLAGLGSEAENRMAWQKQITDMLEEAASGKASRVTALEQQYGQVTQALAQVQQGLQTLAQAQQTQTQLQIWTLMAFLTVAEAQTGGSITQILGTAISDSAMFQKLVEQATGKA